MNFFKGKKEIYKKGTTKKKRKANKAKRSTRCKGFNQNTKLVSRRFKEEA